MRFPGRWAAVFAAVLAAALLAACQKEMRDAGRIKPLEADDFFPNRQSARPFPTGAVPAGGEFLGFEIDPENEPLNTGRDENGDLLVTPPVDITVETLERGREQYDVFCSPCHGLDGYGTGMVVLRGFPQPPSLHEDRLRQAPVGHFFDVITNGFGVMFPYDTRIAPEDRWAVAAYIRALQLSQNATEADVPPGEQIDE